MRLWGFTKRLYTYVCICMYKYVCMYAICKHYVFACTSFNFICVHNKHLSMICLTTPLLHSPHYNYLLIINHPSFEHFLTIWHPFRPSAQRKLINSTYKHTLRSFTFACKQNKWEYFLTLIIHATCFCFVAVTVTVVCVCV